MKRIVKSIKWLFAFSIMSLMAFPSLSLAQTQQAGIQISPLTYSFEIKPNQTRSGNLYIRNLDSTPMEYVIETELFSETSEDGAPSFTGVKKEEGVNDLTNWIEFDKPTEGTVAVGDQIDITFEINVPENAEPGGHYAAIFARQIKKDAEGKTQLGVASRVGLLILVSVPGDVTKTAEIESFSYSKWLWSGRPDFGLKVKNTGTVHYSSAAELEITPTLGSIQKVDMGRHTILPDTIRSYEGQWNNKYPFGLYKVKAKVTDGNGDEVTTSASFWAIPLVIVIPVLVLIILLWIIIHYMKKNFRLVRAE